jgi:hypothetical protein
MATTLSPSRLDRTRSFKGELRAATAGRKVVGYPIRFNELSQDLGGFRERILPGSITFDPDVRCDFNHNPDFILGRRAAGTLRIDIDANGVSMEADPPEAQWADDLLVSMKRGDINQGSFAFQVLPGGQQITQENGQQIRTLSKILVRRLSVVSDPAYTGTSIQVRNRVITSGRTGVNADYNFLPAPDLSEVRRRKQELAERLEQRI